MQNPDDAPPARSPATGEVVSPSFFLGRDDPLEEALQRRRSAQRFHPDGEPVSWKDLLPVLASLSVGIPGDLAPSDLLDVYLFLHASDGPEPGLYRLDGEGRGPSLIKAGDFRRTAAFLSLEQDLAGDGAAAFSLAGRIAEAIRLRGERGYRDVLLAAGVAGHLLYLGAEAIGWNATGIGAFYDDEVSRALGLSEGVPPVYHHSLGRAVSDHRLVDATGEMLRRFRGEARRGGRVIE